MNRRDVLSVSASIASEDVRRDGLSGASAVSRHRLSFVVPALCALAYPSLLSLLSSGLVLLHGSAAPGRGDWLGQCHRVPDTGASGDAGQLCLWAGARITACPG
jgi:hypothetical protein